MRRLSWAVALLCVLAAATIAHTPAAAFFWPPMEKQATKQSPKAKQSIKRNRRGAQPRAVCWREGDWFCCETGFGWPSCDQGTMPKRK